MDDVEGDDDDDDLWDGWGEEVTAQDTTQNQIQNVSLGDANSTDLSTSNMADDKKKGGGGGTDYKSDIKYDKNNTTNTTTNKKNSKNHKNDKDGDGIKGPGSACKPVSSRAQQQQKRKEIKALKFDREKAKRLETIMIKAQKLQLYEEEKKFRNQNEQGKKENEEKSTEKTEIERSVIENENKIINENDNRKEEKIIENESLNSDSKEMKVTPLSVTPSPEIKKTVEKSNTENRGEKKEEKEEMGEEKKEDILSIAGRVQETIEVDATVEKKIVQKVVKKVVKEVEVCDGDTNHEYGDSDSVEEDDDDDDVDHEVEVEVGAKNILTPSNQEDDDDALLKRRSLGRGFLRDIMAEYDNNNSNSNSNLNVLKETKESSSLTSKTEQLPLPLSSSIIATIGASNLGSDPRLSELLGTLAASQQSCLKLWSPKKVSENAYTKVSVRTYYSFNFEKRKIRNIYVDCVFFPFLLFSSFNYLFLLFSNYITSILGIFTTQEDSCGWRTMGS